VTWQSLHGVEGIMRLAPVKAKSFTLAAWLGCDMARLDIPNRPMDI
jgi:hypothetical protein